MKPSDIQKLRIYTLLETQFPGVTRETIIELLGEIEIEVSRKTNRIRSVYDHSKESKILLLSLRTSDGRLLPSFEFGRRLHEINYDANTVTVQNDVTEFIEKGKSVFCKHVKHAGDNVYPQSEVLISNEDGKYLGVGTSVQPGYAMLELRDGIAVKVKKSKNN